MRISGTFKVESYYSTYYCTQSLCQLQALAHGIRTACVIGPAKSPPLPLPIASPIPPNMLRPSPVLRGPLLDVEPDLT